MSEEVKPRNVTAPANFKEFDEMKEASPSKVVNATINDLLASDEPIPVILETLNGQQVHLRVPKYKDFQVVYKASRDDQFKANILLVNRCLMKPQADLGTISQFKVPVIIEIVQWLNKHGGADKTEAERAKNLQEEQDLDSGE